MIVSYEHMEESMAKASSDAKDHLIQFRVDDNFMKRLQFVAAKKSTPPGVIARQWIAERLAMEFEITEKDAERWVEHRHPLVQGIAKHEMESGFGLVCHLVPLAKDVNLSMEQLSWAGSLFTFSSKAVIEKGVNISGYYLRTHFHASSKASWHTEIFCSGQIEGIQLIPEIEEHVVSASAIEDALVQTIFVYCHLLEALRIVPPIDIRIGFIGVHNYQVRASSKDKLGTRFAASDFSFPNTLLTSYEQVETTQDVGELLAQPIRMIWNAAGLKNKKRGEVT